MGKLTYNEVDYLIRGMEYKFKNTPTKETKKQNLNRQFFIRDAMISFVNNKTNVKSVLVVSAEDGELIKKKLEFTFKKRKCTQEVLDKLCEL